MASEHPVLAQLETTIGRYRDTIARLTPELAHLREDKEILMQFLTEFGSSLKTLIADRQSSDQKAAAEATRADAAEKQVADLQAQIAADEATLKGMLDETNSEISTETSSSSSSTASSAAPVVTTTPAGATVTVVPAAATSPAVDPGTGASTAPGTTSHVDSDGTTTVVSHDTGVATAADASGAAVTPPAAAVQAAVEATLAAGVTAPAAS